MIYRTVLIFPSYRPVAIGSFSTPVSGRCSTPSTPRTGKRPTQVWKVQTPSFEVVSETLLIALN